MSGRNGHGHAPAIAWRAGDACEDPRLVTGPEIEGLPGCDADDHHVDALAESLARIAVIEPTPLSELVRENPNREWIVANYIPRGSITLFSALWKSGKTTLLAHLLRSLSAGSTFVGQETRPCKILVITEEDSDLWCDRRDDMALTDATEIIPSPFMGRPSVVEWRAFITRIEEIVERDGYDLVIIDTLPAVWPVENENDASQVTDAILPLRKLRKLAAVILVHHLRKADGQEATASRGSGALAASVDVILELRRVDKDNLMNRQRRLTAFGRWSCIPPEVVIELEGGEYRVVGDGASLAAVKRDARLQAKANRRTLERREIERDVLEAIRSLAALGEKATEGKIKAKSHRGLDSVKGALFNLLEEGLIRKLWDDDIPGTKSGTHVYQTVKPNEEA